MKSFFQTIYNFIFSPCEIENINNKKPIQDSGIVEKFTGDSDKNTSNISYNRIFPHKPFIEPFNCELSIIDKNTEGELSQDSFFDNLKITFNPQHNFLKLSNKNSKPVKRNLIKEFN